MSFELESNSASDNSLDTGNQSDYVFLVPVYSDKPRLYSQDAKFNAAKAFRAKPFEIRDALDTNADSLISQDEIKYGIKYSIQNNTNADWLPGLQILDKHFDSIKGITERGRHTEASGISAQDIIVLGHVAKSRIQQERNFSSAKNFVSNTFNSIDVNGDGRVSYAEFTRFKSRGETAYSGSDGLESVFGKVASGKENGKLVPDSSFSLKEIMEFDVSKDHKSSMKKGIYEFASRPYPNQELTSGVGLVVGTVTGLVMGVSLPLSIAGGVLGVGIVKGVDYLTDNLATYRRVNRLQNEVIPSFLDK